MTYSSRLAHNRMRLIELELRQTPLFVPDLTVIML